MKNGYTTGACGAAGVRAGLLALLGNEVEDVTIYALTGEEINIPIESIKVEEDSATVEVIKDAGDDPDITNGVSVFTTIKIRKWDNDINFFGGLGIGKVTQPGLAVPVGEPSINMGPRKMMEIEARKLLPKEWGLDITISIPKGVELAKKTLNPILGIEGGISIIGTTGIVRPMSEEGFKNSLTPQISVAKAKGFENIVFVPGKIGENIAKEYNIPAGSIVQISNFIGHMLEFAQKEKVKSVLLFGHLGKLCKVSGGIFYTHSKIADARQEILASYAALFGMDKDGVEEIFKARTTEAIIPIIEKYQLDKKGFYDYLAKRASIRAMQHVFGEITVGTVMITLKGELLGMDEEALRIGCELGWNIK